MTEYKMTTRHHFNFYEISSMLQKSIRRGLLEDSLFAANELFSKYRDYLWKRLFTVSAEDCHDLVSSYVYELRCKDKMLGNSDDRRYVSEAVCLLVYANKNRDADYFACNLMNSRDRIELPSIEPTLTSSTEVQFPTKNGHGMFDVSAELIKAVKKADYNMVGYCANELYVRYWSFLWTTIQKLAKEVCENFHDGIKEIEALHNIDKEQHGQKNETSIYVAKALVILVKLCKYKESIFTRYEKTCDVDMSRYDNIVRKIPMYVFDCHTYIGKKQGKTKKDFVVEEQRSLRPLFECDFDHASWDRFFELCNIGFYDKDNLTPRPDEKTMKAISKGDMQLNLF